MSIKWNGLFCFGLGLVLLQAPDIFADEILVELSGRGSGSFEGSVFTDADFLIFGIAGTDALTTSNNVSQILTETSGVSVDGFGTSMFSDKIQLAVSREFNRAGFGNNTQNKAIAFVESGNFKDYFLDQTIGPIVGEPIFNIDFAHQTSNGSFSLNSISSLQFNATVGVPEPSAHTLLSSLLLFTVTFRKLLKHH